jgi:ElaB/YqjD/DUF883 family membrane-anchored ribosome-binding protein
MEKAKAPLNKAGQEIFSNVQDIKEDVAGLARSLRDTSAEKARAATDYVQDRVNDLKETGAEVIDKTERRIKASPGKSVAIAFAAGLLASYLLGRRLP